MGTLDNGQPGYVLEPNLRKDLSEDVVPSNVDLIIPVNSGDEIVYKLVYEQAFGNNKCSLYVYSNV